MGIVPPLTFTLPDGFRALPLEGDTSERTAAVLELAADVYPDADSQIQTAAAALYALMADTLVAGGVEFAAFGLFGDSDGGVAHCTLTIAAQQSEHPSPEVAAAGITEIFVRDPLRDTRRLDLPCGPAVAVVTARALPCVPGSNSAVAELPVGQIQVLVPFPDGPYTALFTLETTALEQWDQVCGIMAALVRSVRFVSRGSRPS